MESFRVEILLVEILEFKELTIYNVIARKQICLHFVVLKFVYTLKKIEIAGYFLQSVIFVNILPKDFKNWILLYTSRTFRNSFEILR